MSPTSLSPPISTTAIEPEPAGVRRWAVRATPARHAMGYRLVLDVARMREEDAILAANEAIRRRSR